MLNPNGRILLTDAIAPEPGYQLDHAIFTSFTLDLTTLMEIPVALTFQEWKAKDPESKLSRIAVLDAIQRYVGRLTVVSQAGSINGPTKGHPLLPLLEPAIAPIVMPAHSTFHPKVTLIRYLAQEEALDDGAEGVTYKMVCSSRNLSQSRAWDTIVVLDGNLTNRRQADSNGLDRFVKGVARMAETSPAGIDPERAAKLDLMASELPRVCFQRPPEIKDGKGHMRMIPIGFGGRFRPEPVRDDQKRLVITPFLGGPSDELRGDRILEEFASDETTLVSRQSELDRVPADLLARFGEILVLSDVVEEAESDSGSGEPEPSANGQSDLRGLHAKLVVEDDGHSSRILIGSPNLSDRAFSQNREFALQLTVSKYLNGVEKILGTDPKSGLRPYLQEYRRAAVPDDSEAEVRAAERQIDGFTDQLLRAGLMLRIEATSGEESDHRDIWLEVGEPVSGLPDDVSAEARPVSLAPEKMVALDFNSRRAAAWPKVPIQSITSLFTVRVTTEAEGKPVSRTFVTKVRLADPLPENRDRLIIRQLIDSSNNLLSYLAFLLAGSNDPSVAISLLDRLNEAPEPNQVSGGRSGMAPTGLPLMEKLVQAVDRDPESIESIALIVNQLGEDEEGRKTLTDSGFENVWRPVLEAHRLRKKGQR